MLHWKSEANCRIALEKECGLFALEKLRWMLYCLGKVELGTTEMSLETVFQSGELYSYGELR